MIQIAYSFFNVVGQGFYAYLYFVAIGFFGYIYVLLKTQFNSLTWKRRKDDLLPARAAPTNDWLFVNHMCLIFYPIQVGIK
jgi:hypothetical protein